MRQYVFVQLKVIFFVWSTGGSKFCSLVVSENLLLLGRLVSGNRGRAGDNTREGVREGEREGVRDRARESSSWLSWQQGNAPWDRVFPR